MDPLDRLDVVIYYVRIIRNLYPHSHSNTNVTKVLNEVLLMDIDLVFELCLPCQDWKSLTNQATCKELFLDLSKLIHYDATSVTHTPSDTTLIDATTWYSVKTERTTKDYKESLQRTESLLKDRDLKKLAFFSSSIPIQLRSTRTYRRSQPMQTFCCTGWKQTGNCTRGRKRQVGTSKGPPTIYWMNPNLKACGRILKLLIPDLIRTITKTSRL